MKTKEHATNKMIHPAVNWIFPLLGIVIIAISMSCSTTFHVLTFALLSGPFFLLGLACHICRKSAATRVLGFKLTAIQFTVTLFCYFLIYALAWLSVCGILDLARSAFVFTWLFAIVSFFVLLARAASDETPANTVSEPPQNPPKEQES